ncbi:MAG: ComEC/Rec2 family competence protein [Rhizobiaceae bacterium]
MADIHERARQDGTGEREMFAPGGDVLPAAPASLPLRPGEFTPRNSRLPGLWRTMRPAFWPEDFRTAIALERERGGAFLLAPILLALGALAYYSAADEPDASVLAAGAAALAAIAWLLRNRPVACLAALSLLFVVLGMGFAKLETLRAGTKVLGAEISTRLTGRVVLIEHQASGRVRLTIDVLKTERPTLRYAPERVRVSARAVPPGLEAGMVVAGLASLIPPSGPLRPDGYDFSFESYFDGIGANGFFMKGPDLAEAPPAGAGTRLGAWIENARTALADRIEARIGGPEGEIAAALVAGVRVGIPEEVNEALRRTGLAHVLSISGLHMVLVAATIMGVLRLGFALFPGFASRRPVKKYAALVALVAIAFYLFISGSAVAAERSFIMLAVMLVAVLFDRSALTMRNLAISALVVLVLSPHEVAGPSFQMSFAATAALIGAYGWWSDRRRKRQRDPPPQLGPMARMLRIGLLYAGGLAATSIVAGLATTLFGIWHFQRVSPFSLAANLVAMPAVSVLVMPFAVLAVAAMPFGLDGPFLDVMGFGLSVMLAVSAWFSERSPIDAVGTIPMLALALGTITLLIATLATTRLRALAVPGAAATLVALLVPTSPTILVSEDARLVGVRTQSGEMAVNRSRPNAFTAQTWQRAMAAHAIRSPTRKSGPDEGAFSCADALCIIQREGAVVAWAESGEAAERACASAALLIVADPAAKVRCASGRAQILSAKDLARHGSAEIVVSADGDRHTVAVRHAVGEPTRPWHAHRVYSRAARGLPPWKREEPAQPQ